MSDDKAVIALGIFSDGLIEAQHVGKGNMGAGDVVNI